MSNLKKLLADLGIKKSDLCRLCFEAAEDVGNDHFKCKLCPIVRKKVNGLTSLTSHLEDKHLSELKDYVKSFQYRRMPRTTMIGLSGWSCATCPFRSLKTSIPVSTQGSMLSLDRSLPNIWTRYSLHNCQLRINFISFCRFSKE